MQHPISEVLLTTSLLLLSTSLGNAQNTNVLTGEYQPSGVPPVYPDTMGSGRYPGSGTMGSGRDPGSGTMGSGRDPGSGTMGSGSYPFPGSGQPVHPTPDTSKKTTCNRIADEWNQVKDKIMSLRDIDERVTRLYQEIQRINLEFKRLWETGEL